MGVTFVYIVYCFLGGIFVNILVVYFLAAVASALVIGLLLLTLFGAVGIPFMRPRALLDFVTVPASPGMIVDWAFGEAYVFLVCSF